MGQTESKVEYVEREKVVYREPPAPKMLERPWRKLDISGWKAETRNDLIRHAQKYVPVEGVKYANILLLGPIGAGKSSFFNTVQTSLSTTGVLSRRAGVGSDVQSYTRGFHKYRMKSEGIVKFRMCDCRGIENANSIPVEDVLAILDGHMKNGYKINPTGKIEKSDAKYEENPKLEDKIHCIVWFFEVNTPFEMLSNEEKRQIKTIQEFAIQRGVGQLVLLSKIDQVAKEIESDIRKAFYSNDLKKSVELFAHSFGLPVSSILPMKNYSKEVSKDVDVDILALFNLKQMLSVADESLMNLIDDYDDDE